MMPLSKEEIEKTLAPFDAIRGSLPVEKDKIERGENINLLNETEWRTIHNALSVYLCKYDAESATRYGIQKLMDKIRHNYIDPYQELDSQTR